MKHAKTTNNTAHISHDSTNNPRLSLLLLASLVVLSIPSLSFAQGQALGDISRDQAAQQISSGGYTFTDIGLINGLPTLTAPGTGISILLQGPPEKLQALTVRWNGRYVDMDAIRDHFVGLLEPIAAQVTNDFFWKLQRKPYLVEINESGTTVTAKYRKLGNQVSWEIHAKLDE